MEMMSGLDVFFVFLRPRLRKTVDVGAILPTHTMANARLNIPVIIQLKKVVSLSMVQNSLRCL